MDFNIIILCMPSLFVLWVSLYLKASFSLLLDVFNVSVVRHFCFIGIIFILIR